MSVKTAEEIFNEIKMKNSKRDLHSIPHSDDFESFLSSNLGIDIDYAREMIKILIKSHKIFAIEIVAQDKKRNIPRIEAYVEASLPNVLGLKNFFQDELVKLYEKEYYKRVSYYRAIKDIIPKIRTLNNTPIGQIANKAIMLGEYEKLLENNFSEYTDSWKERQFGIEIKKITELDTGKSNISYENEEVRKGKASHKYDRAVDSSKYNDFISKSNGYPIDRILKIYGIDFFLRVHIRNYKFSYLIEILERGYCFKKADLVKLRNLIHKVKLNFDKDPKLIKCRDDIQTLERMVSHNLYFSGKKGQ